MVGLGGTDGRPSLDVVRNMTDGQVLAELLEHGELTRAQVAARTGISRPTVSESIRRLREADLVTEVGREQGGRGRAGILLRVPPEVGSALVVHAGPDGVVGESLDVAGTTTVRRRRSVVAPITAELLGSLLQVVVTEVLDTVTAPVLTTAISVADPVDQASGRLVELPGAPFLLGELAPRDLVAPLLADHARRHPATAHDDRARPDGPDLVDVDNDVNWAVLAEQRMGAASDSDHVVLLWLGPGIGAGTITHGRIARGARGLAGEVAHAITIGPDGTAMSLQQVFGALDLLVDDTFAIDVDGVSRALDDDGRPARAIVTALVGICRSITALVDPDLVLVGGPWGRRPDLAVRLDDRLRAEAAVPARVTTARFGQDGPIRGARLHANMAVRKLLTGKPA